ncbi:MAG TPA: hypothetical protein VEH84_00875 [Alphaproteobacteria bacterium]|nr:hypothetical protein [Alphaproteobacteria bacterium]
MLDLLKMSSAQLAAMQPRYFDEALRSLSATQVRRFLRLRSLNDEKRSIAERYLHELQLDPGEPTLWDHLVDIGGDLVRAFGLPLAGIAAAIGLLWSANALMEWRALEEMRDINIPGASAWVRIGVYDTEAKSFLDGPSVAMVSMPTGEREFWLARGDVVRTQTDLPLYVLDYRKTRMAKLHRPPVLKAAVEPVDETGVVAIPGVELTVLELAFGRKVETGRGWEVWARVNRP